MPEKRAVVEFYVDDANSVQMDVLSIHAKDQLVTVFPSRLNEEKVTVSRIVMFEFATLKELANKIFASVKLYCNEINREL